MPSIFRTILNLRFLATVTLLFVFPACRVLPGLGGGTDQTNSVERAVVLLQANNQLDQITVPLGESVGLSWNAINVTSCQLNGESVELMGFRETDPLQRETLFSVVCGTADGTLLSSSVRVSVSATETVATPSDPTGPAPTLSLSASPVSVTVGGNTTLNYQISNVTSCTLNGGGNYGPSNGSISRTNLQSTQVYVFQCTGPGGTVSDSVTVNVEAASSNTTSTSTPTDPLPTISLSANPKTIAYDSFTDITWSTTDATICSLDGVTRSTQGSRRINDLKATRTFVLVCSGPGGSASRSVSVTVSAPPQPVVDLKVRDGGGPVSDGTITIPYLTSARLSWTSSNVDTCSLNGTGVTKSRSNFLTGPLQKTTSYTLSCTGPGGTRTDSVTVEVPCGSVEVSTAGSLRHLLDNNENVCVVRGAGQNSTVISLDSPLVVNRPVTLEKMTLVKNGNFAHVVRVDSSNVTLRHVTVNTGSAANIGNPNNAGIFVSPQVPNLSNIVLDHVHVRGNGRGTGIRIVNANGVTITAADIRDMRATTGGSGNHLIGISAHNSQVNIAQGSVTGLEPNVSVSNGVVDTRTIGILFSNMRNSSIRDAFVSNVGVGIRVGGDATGNQGITIHNAVVEKAATYCYSLEYFDGVVEDSTGRECGRAGVAIESRPGPTRRTVIRGVTVEEVGWNRLFTNIRTAGFYVFAGPAGTTPSPIEILEWAAVDAGQDRTMDWGTYSEVFHPNVEVQLSPAGSYTFQGVPGQASHGFVP